MSLSIGAQAQIGPLSISAGISLGDASQTFRTMPVPMPGLALYTLAVYAPDDDGGGDPVMDYTFPLSPQALRKDYSAMTAVYETQGTPEQSGVQRIIDMYGNSPLTFTIGGTTGQQYHSTDGFAYTGLESIQQILDVLDFFAQSNQQQMAQNNPSMFTMEFYDYFTETFWQVVPVGPQGITQSVQQPTLQFYQFRFAGIQSVDDAPPPDEFTPDVDALFTVSAGPITLNLQAQISFSVGVYGP